jgi:membrane protein
LAVVVLRQLAAAQAQPLHGLNASELAETLRTDPLQIEPILDTLVAIDWVGLLDEAGDARYVLLCDPDTTPATRLVGQLLLEPAPSMEAFWKRAGFGEMTVRELMAR